MQNKTAITTSVTTASMATPNAPMATPTTATPRSLPSSPPYPNANSAPAPPPKTNIFHAPQPQTAAPGVPTNHPPWRLDARAHDHHRDTGILTLNWPSNLMIDNARFIKFTNFSIRPANRFFYVLNLGVGGGKIQNMAYRLLGDASQDLKGLAGVIAARKSARLWVVHAGTNNLDLKKGLTDADRDALAMVLRGVLKIEGAEGYESRVLLTGLFPRGRAASV